MRTGFGIPSGRRWFVAAGAATVVALAGTGVALLMFSPAPAGRPEAAGCGLVTCGASLPLPVTGEAAPGTRRPAHRRQPARTPAPSATSRTPPPEAAPRPRHHPPSPQPAPSPTGHGHRPHVKVTYTLDDGGGHGHHAFRAHLTIVSNGHQAIAGWAIELSLPGDQVSWVGFPSAPQPFAIWQLSGSSLVLHAVSGGETLPPGGTEIVPIFAAGPSTYPSGCTFNGAPCRP